jgi:molybdate transport system substrate-binding protein
MGSNLEDFMIRRRIVLAVVVLGLLVVPRLTLEAAADEITVLCSNGLQAVVADLVPKFEAATRHKVAVTYTLAATIKQRIEGGEMFDVAFVTPAMMDDLIAKGKVSGNTRTTIARSGLALAVRAGAPRPDVGTVESFKRALLGAKSITYVKEGASGVAFAALIQKLGIAEDLKSKTRLSTTGDEVSTAVVKGDVEFGVLPLSEVIPIKGAEPATFPADAQSYIVMVGGVSAASKQAGAAGDLIKYLTAPAALPVIKAKGMEPVTERSTR